MYLLSTRQRNRDKAQLRDGRLPYEALCIPLDRLLAAVDDLLAESAPVGANR
jgi:hypothetical protein